MHDDLVLVRTRKGEEVLRGGVVDLSPKQRIALRLPDGEKTVADIQAYAGKERTVDSWYELIREGYLHPLKMETAPFNDYSELQRKLTSIIICNLNEKASATFNIIDNLQETPEGISEALYKVERLVRLTIDENIVTQLNFRMSEITS